jgi:hypothetical protein
MVSIGKHASLCSKIGLNLQFFKEIMLEVHERNIFREFYEYRCRPYVGLITEACMSGKVICPIM